MDVKTQIKPLNNNLQPCKEQLTGQLLSVYRAICSSNLKLLVFVIKSLKMLDAILKLRDIISFFSLIFL